MVEWICQNTVIQDMSVYDDVNTMVTYYYPYRNEMVRLLLHSFYAIKVSFFIPKQKHVIQVDGGRF